MKLPFLNRSSELKALRAFAKSREPSLAVVYGRRRCGKSRLLQSLGAPGVAYYLADSGEQALQRSALAAELDPLLPGFGSGTYATWKALFDAVNGRVGGGKPPVIVLDEFPYLVAEHPALPAVIQKMIDTSALRFHLVLCGSSQRMMKGLVLDETAPLHGRAREIIKIRPLKPGWIVDAMGGTGARAIEQYAVWGGVPRYWELAAEYADQTRALQDLVFNRDGVLHLEPRRLLRDDMRTDTQPHSLLAVIGAGVHRLSEMSARLQKPAMNLLRPLEILIELGLVRRDIPFGEREKNSKKTLYVIADPFLRFWYRYVNPFASALEQELYDQPLSMWRKTRDQHFGAAWEDLARESVPHIPVGGKKWGGASRWWGKNAAGEMLEIDVVAESQDGTSLLLGEVKWGARSADDLCRNLRSLVPNLPFINGRKVVTACWIGHPGNGADSDRCIRPQQVLDVLR